MGDKTTKKHQKLKGNVYAILDENRCTNNDETKEITHQSYGGFFNGTFSLDSDERKKFMKAYCAAIDGGVSDLTILERQKEFGPIVVDIDLEVPKDSYKENTRLYSRKMIKTICIMFLKSMEQYLDLPSGKTFNVCVFEKEKPQDKEISIKDGFHIVFPETCVQTKIRHLIRHNVVKMCESENLFDTFLNTPEKIVDKAVVSSNGWFLYGSGKPGGKPYKLSYIFDKDMNKIYDHNKSKESEDQYPNDHIIKYLSVQSSSYRKKNATNIKKEYVDSDIDAECHKLGIISTLKAEVSNTTYVPPSKEDVVKRACAYTSMLADSRARDYDDWRNVGLALHSIDNSLLGTWIEFSRKCPSKFKEGECEKIWNKIKTSGNGKILTIRSLAYWAKQDDPKQFEAFNKSEFKNKMTEIPHDNTYLLAKSIFMKYSNTFVCSNISKNIWWEFKNHRWVRVQDGYTLKIKLSEEFANEYNKEISEISLQMQKNFSELLRIRRDTYSKIVGKLMNTSFKEIIIRECRNLFYDDKFEQKLDSNVNLLGFENGVYDFEKDIFRDGLPDDYITMSTKQDYIKFSTYNPIYSQIQTFFEQVFPIKSVREYFIMVLSSCVTGITSKNEKFYIMTGSGSNGKSLTNDLMKLALGDYYMSCDISLITRKRGQSNQAAPEKVRMRGRRCGVFQEADDDEKLNVGVIKELTGGDTMCVRDLFKGADEMLELKPQMKYFLTANQLPDVPSTDEGTWRRITKIDFISKFVDHPKYEYEYKVDTDLKGKIELWAPFFVSYLIDVYQNQGGKEKLEIPSEVQEATNQYKRENDYLSEYLEVLKNNIEITKNKEDKINEDKIWKGYKDWFSSVYPGKHIQKRQDVFAFFNKYLAKRVNNEFVGIKYKVIGKETNDSQTDNDYDD
jgi:P4 family phage/plasmid primase-like protien